MLKIILCELINAYRGKREWNRLKRKYGRKNGSSHYIFFSDTDIEYSALGLLYLDEYIKKKVMKPIIPIVKDTVIRDSFRTFVHLKTVEPVLISAKKMHQLMKFYALVDMSDQWTSISVKEPYDTYAEHLLGHHGVTKQDLICYDVYKMDSVPKVGLPSLMVNKEADTRIISLLKKYIQ